MGGGCLMIMNIPWRMALFLWGRGKKQKKKKMMGRHVEGEKRERGHWVENSAADIPT